MDSYVTIDSAEIIRETPRAYKFLIDGEEYWIPKSQIRAYDDGLLEITVWIATQKGLMPTQRRAPNTPPPPPSTLTLTADDLPQSARLYRQLMKKYHPDKGGPAELATDINQLWQTVFDELRKK